MFGKSGAFPLTDRFLASLGQRSREQELLKTRASRARSFEVYDFNTSVTSGAQYNVWTVAATSTGTTWATLAEPGGWIRGVTGASIATAGLQLYGTNKFFNGTKGAGFASLIRVSGTVGLRLEQGFADVLPAVSTTVVNLASAAFASTVAGAVYLFDDGSASTPVSGLYTIGVSIGYSAVATTTNRYSSAVTLFVMVEVNGTTAECWVGDGDRPLAKKTSALEAANGLIPFISAKKLAGASVNIDVDTIWTWTNGRN